MSLINDALKKAQKQQDPLSADAAAVTGSGASAVAPAGLRRGKSSGPGLERWLLGIVALVVVLVGLTVVGVLVFRKEGPPQIAAASRPTASTPVAPTAPAASVPAPAAPMTAAPSPTASAPPAAPLASAPTVAAAVPNALATPAAPMTSAPTVTSASPAPAASSSPAVEPPAIAAATAPTATVSAPAPAPASPSVQVNLSASAPAPEPAPPPRAAPPEPKPVPPAASPEMPYHRRVLAFVDSLHVTGVRAAGDDSKVLMNDRVYRIGDIVEHELGLKLVAITSSSVTFVDGRGAKYTRNF